MPTQTLLGHEIDTSIQVNEGYLVRVIVNDSRIVHNRLLEMLGRATNLEKIKKRRDELVQNIRAVDALVKAEADRPDSPFWSLHHAPQKGQPSKGGSRKQKAAKDCKKQEVLEINDTDDRKQVHTKLRNNLACIFGLSNVNQLGTDTGVVGKVQGQYNVTFAFPNKYSNYIGGEGPLTQQRYSITCFANDLEAIRQAAKLHIDLATKAQALYDFDNEQRKDEICHNQIGHFYIKQQYKFLEEDAKANFERKDAVTPEESVGIVFAITKNNTDIVKASSTLKMRNNFLSFLTNYIAPEEDDDKDEIIAFAICWVGRSTLKHNRQNEQYSESQTREDMHIAMLCSQINESSNSRMVRKKKSKAKSLMEAIITTARRMSLDLLVIDRTDNAKKFWEEYEYTTSLEKRKFKYHDVMYGRVDPAIARPSYAQKGKTDKEEGLHRMTLFIGDTYETYEDAFTKWNGQKPTKENASKKWETPRSTSSSIKALSVSRDRKNEAKWREEIKQGIKRYVKDKDLGIKPIWVHTPPEKNEEKINSFRGYLMMKGYQEEDWSMTQREARTRNLPKFFFRKNGEEWSTKDDKEFYSFDYTSSIYNLLQFKTKRLALHAGDAERARHFMENIEAQRRNAISKTAKTLAAKGRNSKGVKG